MINIFIVFFEFINKQKKLLLSIGLLGIILLGFYLKHKNVLDMESIIELLKDHPVISPIIFSLLYIAMIIFLIPTLFMNLAAGFLWGAFWGGIITIISATTGASLAFMISRYLAHEYFEYKFRKNRIWNWLQVEIKNQNWKAVAFTRANPAFPFGVLSYLFGLTNIEFKSYVWSTLIFIFPGVFVFTAIGASLGGVILSSDISAVLGNVFWIGFFVALLVLLSMGIKYYAHITSPNLDDHDKIES